MLLAALLFTHITCTTATTACTTPTTTCTAVPPGASSAARTAALPAPASRPLPIASACLFALQRCAIHHSVLPCLSLPAAPAVVLPAGLPARRHASRACACAHSQLACCPPPLPTCPLACTCLNRCEGLFASLQTCWQCPLLCTSTVQTCFQTARCRHSHMQ